jgi:hypothetical protein
MPRSVWVAILSLSLLSPPLATALFGKHHDEEAKLQAHIDRERNPVKKAKLEIRLGRLKLEQAEAAYDQDQVKQGAALLASYERIMQTAWQTLQSSGRNAARQPQGFKELDIALREGLRRLDDLKHRISYYDRDPVEKTNQQLTKERSEVLQALFPTLKPAPQPKRFLAPGAVSGRLR